MQGSCLCGAVLYEVEASALLIGHCSCRTCRKAHAAPFTTTARVPRDSFKWRAGADKLRHFESSPGIWRSQEAPWLAYEGDIKRFDEWPPGRVEGGFAEFVVILSAAKDLMAIATDVLVGMA